MCGWKGVPLRPEEKKKLVGSPDSVMMVGQYGLMPRLA